MSDSTFRWVMSLLWFAVAALTVPSVFQYGDRGDWVGAVCSALFVAIACALAHLYLKARKR